MITKVNTTNIDPNPWAPDGGWMRQCDPSSDHIAPLSRQAPKQDRSSSDS